MIVKISQMFVSSSTIGAKQHHGYRVTFPGPLWNDVHKVELYAHQVGSHCNEWTQTSNPATESTITGFKVEYRAVNKTSRKVSKYSEY